MIDIGVNLGHSHFRDRIDEVLNEAKEAGVEHIIATGSDLPSSGEAQRLSQSRPSLTFTAGIHPHHAESLGSDAIESFRRLWSDEKCVAVGELGLDYNRMYQEASLQRECLVAQIEASQDCALPLFLHLREADSDFLDIIKTRVADRKKVVHCYTGNAQTLRQLLDLGSMIGITGWICDDRRNQDLIESLEYLPIDRIMIETDAPWLLPRTIEGFRRIRHNHPRFLPHILQELSRRKGVDIDQLGAQIRANTIEFFGLGNLLGPR